MDCEDLGGIVITGNFAELQDSKPEPFNYDRTAKWIEPYSLEWREVLGNAVCNCTTMIVHYAPYYGYDYFHRDTCNLMRKLKAEPGIANLREIYLPAITHYTDSVPNSDKLPIWVKGLRPSRPAKVKIRVVPMVEARQAVLL